MRNHYDNKFIVETSIDKKGKYGRLLGKLFRIKKSEHFGYSSEVWIFQRYFLWSLQRKTGFSDLSAKVCRHRVCQYQPGKPA